VIAHYRGTNILDYHTASSQVVGVEDSLIAQSLQNSQVGDCFYFAISPDVGDLTHFNYNLGSLKCQPQFLFPHDLPIGFINPSGKQIPIGCSFGKVTEDFSAGLTIYGAGGGGGAGEPTINNAGGTFIGRGGGGGGAGTLWSTTGSGSEDIDFKKGDKIEFYLGHGGIGGSATGANPDGAKGQESWVKLTRNINGQDIADFIGPNWPPGQILTTPPNPIPGGCGGIGGTGGGHGGTGFDAGGGGGGAGLINGSPNSPGSGGDTVLPPIAGGNPGSDGGTSPRNGGKGGILPVPPTPPGLGVGGAGGGIGISSKMGSGGGGGSAFQSAFHVVDPDNPNSSSGGNGGMPGITGSSGMSGAASQGGGGGGSGGLGPQDSFILGGNGGKWRKSYSILLWRRALSYYV